MLQPIKQYEVLNWASSFLEKNGRETSVAEILLLHHLQISRSAFFMQMQEEIPPSIFAAYRSNIEKHVETGIPIQHIIGTAPFYGREFHVSKDVLIPRFDTEVLIEHVIEGLRNLPEGFQPILVDVGTGSGIIAITLKLEVPELTVYATDISEEALHIAHKNAQRHKADVQFLQGNFLEPLLRKKIPAHIIVSNPPYICYKDKAALMDTVKKYDPPLALYAEEDGLAAYKEIINQSALIGQANLSQIYFEIGDQQANAVTGIIHNAYRNGRITTYQDLNGKDRVVIANLL